MLMFRRYSRPPSSSNSCLHHGGMGTLQVSRRSDASRRSACCFFVSGIVHEQATDPRETGRRPPPLLRHIPPHGKFERPGMRDRAITSAETSRGPGTGRQVAARAQPLCLFAPSLSSLPRRSHPVGAGSSFTKQSFDDPAGLRVRAASQLEPSGRNPLCLRECLGSCLGRGLGFFSVSPSA